MQEKIKAFFNYRIPSRLTSTGVKVKTLLIFILAGLIITPIMTSYQGQSLESIAVSKDGNTVAYVSSGYGIPNVLRVSKSDGTLVFEHKFTAEETSGGSVIVFFKDEKICAYTFRRDLFITFGDDGRIESKEELTDYDYPDKYSDFKKGFSVYSHRTETGEYEYTNADIFNSFVLRKPRELVFVDSEGNRNTLWQGLE